MRKNLAAFSLIVFSGIALAVPATPPGSVVAFITDIKGEVALDGARQPSLLTELAEGQTLSLMKNASLVVMFIRSGAEFSLKGPGEYKIRGVEIIALQGSSPSVRATRWRPEPGKVVETSKSATASLRMRSAASAVARVHAPVFQMVYPVDTRIATLQPTLRWGDGAKPYTIVVSSEGKEIFRADADANSLKLPIKLASGKQYIWTANSSSQRLGPLVFSTLTQDELKHLADLKPGAAASFSDRLMYALTLRSLDVRQEANEIWGKLARERPDLPELAALAR
jgi:hypothetical protein